MIAENNGPRPALLFVLDGIRPDVLGAAIRDGDAPNLGMLAQRGEAVWDAVSVFPSITPAATAAIATGEAPARSGIVGHAWYDKDRDGERSHKGLPQQRLADEPRRSARGDPLRGAARPRFRRRVRQFSCQTRAAHPSDPHEDNRGLPQGRTLPGTFRAGSEGILYG